MTGVWRGTVTRVEGATVRLVIPRLAGRHEFGPVQAVQVAGGWAVGDRVLVGFVEGRSGDPVVIGRIG